MAQQLAISRDLTQKRKAVESDSDEENVDLHQNVAGVKKTTEENNPWINGVKVDKDVVDFVSGYRKFWNEKNKTVDSNSSQKENDSQLSEAETYSDPKSQSSKTKKKQIKEVKLKNTSESENKSKHTKKTVIKNAKITKVKHNTENVAHAEEMSESTSKMESCEAAVDRQKEDMTKSKSKKKKKISSKGTADWDVQELLKI